MSDRSRVLGIDLGTTNTCVAHVRNHMAKMVPTDRGNLTLPSVVALSARGELLVGGVAKDQMLTNPKNTIYGAKRLIGRSFGSRVVQELRGQFTYDIVEGPNGEAAVKLGDKVYTLPQISSLVLAHVKTISEQFLGGEVSEAIISVPAYYNDNQRNAVKEAGRLAGLTVKRIVNEPTAAALAYGFNRSLDQKILVYDLGGGTFDVSVLEPPRQRLRGAWPPAATPSSAASDFDNRIVDYVLGPVRSATSSVDLRKSPIAMQRIKTAAEAAKIDLTLIPNVVIELPYIEEHKGKPLGSAHPALPRAAQRADRATWSTAPSRSATRCWATRASRPREIAEVILVGGQSRMPLVQEKISEHFGRPGPQGGPPRRVRGAGRGAARRLAGRRATASRWWTCSRCPSASPPAAAGSARSSSATAASPPCAASGCRRRRPAGARSSWTSSRARAIRWSTTSTWAR